MASAQDKHIFVTGIVGRAMGSGKFTGADIQALTDLAAQAFENTFGSVTEAPAPQQPYSPAPGPRSMPQPSMPEGKPFEVWKKDKCGHWDKSLRDVPWETLLFQAKNKDEMAVKALKEMSEDDPGEASDRWYAANLKRIARSKAVLLMI